MIRLQLRYRCKNCKQFSYITPKRENGVVHRQCSLCGFNNFDIIKGPTAADPFVFPFIGSENELSDVLQKNNLGDS